MLVVAVHNRFGDQGIELGITERRHPRRIENRLRRFTSSRQQRTTTGLRFACKIKVGPAHQNAKSVLAVTGDALPVQMARLQRRGRPQ